MKKILYYLLIFLILNSFQVSFAQEKIEKLRPSDFVVAINKGDIETVKRYIESGYHPDKSFMGSTPLIYAIDDNQHDILDYLLDSGANPNLEKGMPPLYYAVSEKNKYAVAKLLKSGADTQKTYMKMSARELAFSYKNPELSNIFIAFETNPNEFNPDLYKNSYNICDSYAILSANVIYNLEKKDTNLIVINKTKPVNQSKFKLKIKNDNFLYQKYKKQIKEEFVDLAIILDRLLRANNLQYQNWRLALNLDPIDINAQAGSVNLIVVNSSLYDSLFQNQDALAFIVAHELSHLILGHIQIGYKNNLTIAELEKQYGVALNQADKQNYLGSINNAVGNYGSALTNSISSLAYVTSAAIIESTIKNIYAQERQMELDADAEAIVLMSRAGYDPEKAKDALEFIGNIPNVYTSRSTHPDNYTRQNNIKEALFLNDIAELKNQGANEILNSKVLSIKKSSDKKTIILPLDPKASKKEYVSSSKEQKLIKKAYMFYLDNDYEQSKMLFKNSYMINSNNFIPMLYLSYINEYQFKENHQKKSFKEAKKWAKKAYRTNSYNEFVKRQYDDIKELSNSIQEEKKNAKKQKKIEKKQEKLKKRSKKENEE